MIDKEFLQTILIWFFYIYLFTNFYPQILINKYVFGLFYKRNFNVNIFLIILFHVNTVMLILIKLTYYNYFFLKNYYPFLC